MGFSNTRNLLGCETWEAAERLFRDPGPRSWHTRSRPLGTQKQEHYRVEQKSDCFEVWLYRTVMARFYKPEGERRVCEYTTTISPTSSSFLWNVCGIGKWNNGIDTEGNRVCWPLDGHSVKGKKYGARIVSVDGRIVVPESEHVPLYREFWNEEDKYMRREVVKRAQFLIDLVKLNETPEATKPWAPGHGPRPNPWLEHVMHDTPLPEEAVLTLLSSMTGFVGEQKVPPEKVQRLLAAQLRKEIWPNKHGFEVYPPFTPDFPGNVHIGYKEP